MATVEELEATLRAAQEELAGAKARITELNAENKGHRLNAQNARAEADAARAELETARKDQAAAIAAAEQKVADAAAATSVAKTEGDAALAAAKTAADARVIHAELRAAGTKAGIVDLDGLKLLDASKVTLNDKGDVVIPDKFFDDAKTAKPWLFGKTGSTSNPVDPPKPGNVDPKTVATMSDEEFDKAVKQKAWLKSA